MQEKKHTQISTKHTTWINLEGFAPLSNNSLTTSTFAFIAAKCKGVAPLLSRWSRVARQSNKASITGIFPSANSVKSASNMKLDNATTCYTTPLLASTSVEFIDPQSTYSLLRSGFQERSFIDHMHQRCHSFQSRGIGICFLAPLNMAIIVGALAHGSSTGWA